MNNLYSMELGRKASFVLKSVLLFIAGVLLADVIMQWLITDAGIYVRIHIPIALIASGFFVWGYWKLRSRIYTRLLFREFHKSAKDFHFDMSYKMWEIEFFSILAITIGSTIFHEPRYPEVLYRALSMLALVIASGVLDFRTFNSEREFHRWQQQHSAAQQQKLFEDT